MNLNLKGKNAFVCGSSKGIGKATAIELAKMGAEITLIARSETALRTVLQELDTSHGQSHDLIVADFTRPDLVQALAKNYLDKSKKQIHILINNTGGPPGGPITEATTEAFLKAYQMHLFCSHLLSQAVLPGMKEAGFGRIINIISTSVKIPINGLGVSNTTRGAMASWSKTLSNEVGKFGITVNNVLPGFTETERLEEIIQANAKKSGHSAEEVAASMKQTTPAQRFASPEEIASVAAFLASPSASYVNGTNIPVDGGRTGSL
ncbi:MAG: SDR family oxidoreductase [Bacteroidetes bacterium]|nr:SDR family oxidoreductase [Bacteroidota bacterium]MCB0843882.1 SDR family oxidoreductase [Bacteroidota bacterium]